MSNKSLEASVYSQAGKEVSKITLSEKVFGAAWNADLVHDVVISMQGNARAGTAHTKGLGDVRGGGKKPWKQKGTGRARHGSSRSPIWRGGGVSHGPTNEREFGRKINKNVRAKALASVLSQKFNDNEIVFVDSIAFDAPKAADARKMLVPHFQQSKERTHSQQSDQMQHSSSLMDEILLRNSVSETLEMSTPCR
jgi:large subunit ribosomal protein L4